MSPAAPKPKLGSILLVFAAVVVAILLWILQSNNGKFVYTLDDPYIHLALARRIGQGHYGINLGENSAPSSSILWPFLLAPLAGTGAGEYLPLVLCLLSALASLSVVIRRFGTTQNPWLLAAGAAILTNQVGLIFTGMEHNLQVCLAILVAVGLLDERDGGKVSLWLVAALVLGPLFRYENLAITLPSTVYLWSRGHRKVALVALTLPLVGIVGFSLFLKSLGLGMLPSSVVAKSGAGTAGNPVRDLLNNFIRNLTSRETLLECYSFLLLLGVLAWGALKLQRQARALALTAAAAGGMHMFLGRFGWAGRYEPYIVAFDGLLLLGLWPELPFTRLEATKSTDFRPLATRVLLVALLPLSLYYIFLRGLRAPNESHDIYLQQYQMHRFVAEDWHGPVAVNDLGWVSWENDQYVLDLWGLGNYEALKLRGTEKDANWMAGLCRKHQVHAAMVYDDWFHGAPKGWVKVAMLSRFQGKPRPRDEVSIYATDPTAVAPLVASLKAFEPTLPSGATLKRVPEIWNQPQ